VGRTVSAITLDLGNTTVLSHIIYIPTLNGVGHVDAIQVYIRVQFITHIHVLTGEY